MTTFSIAIRTVARRRAMFLELLQRLAAAPYDGLVPFYASSEEDVSPNENACIALEGAAKFGADWVLFLEDDAGPVDDFFGSVERWLADHADPTVHIYPLGTVLGTSNVPAIRWPIEQFYCSVALAIRAAQVPSLIAYLRANAHVRTGFDLMAGHWHRTVSESPFLIAVQPCLVDHLGDESTLIDTRPDRNVVGHFPRFLGRDYSYRSTVKEETTSG